MAAFKDFVGRGWAFPPKLSADERLPYIGGPVKVQQSIWIILSTAPGERQMLPDFGCGVHDLVFQANTAALHGMVCEKVKVALTRWEPRIDVLEVRVTSPDEERNRLDIDIDYRLRTNRAFYNLVYPLYLDEGAA